MQTLEEMLIAHTKGKQKQAFDKLTAAKLEYDIACQHVDAIEKIIEITKKEAAKEAGPPRATPPWQPPQ